MKPQEMFEFFNRKEKKILGGIGLVLFLLLLFHFFVALGEKKAYVHSQELMEVRKSEFQNISQKKARLEKDWNQWVQARQHIEELRETYLYTRDRGVETLRKDLQKIFKSSSVHISSLKYNYPESKEENFQSIQVSFDATGSYFSLKKFIHRIEKFPKFLIIEKIDFLDINSESGILKLKIVVSGYYEE